MGKMLAHSMGINGVTQTISDHIFGVESIALNRCPAFLKNDVILAARFHDFGKYSILFQRRLEGLESGLDHWSPGAHLLLKYGLSDLAAMAVHAHHVGLGAWGQVSTLKDSLVSIERKKLTLSTSQEIENAFQAMIDDGIKPQECQSRRRLKRTVGAMLDVRMVLSALVHADYVDTARHMHGEKRLEMVNLDAHAAFASLEKYVGSLSKEASAIIKKVRKDQAYSNWKLLRVAEKRLQCSVLHYAISSGIRRLA
jgi:CRISPR-associated endonuclease Cas3-HD